MNYDIVLFLSSQKYCLKVLCQSDCSKPLLELSICSQVYCAERLWKLQNCCSPILCFVLFNSPLQWLTWVFWVCVCVCVFDVQMLKCVSACYVPRLCVCAFVACAWACFQNTTDTSCHAVEMCMCTGISSRFPTSHFFLFASSLYMHVHLCMIMCVYN